MWKRLFLAAVISSSASSAVAQTGAEIKLALDAAHFSYRVMQGIDEAQNRDERLRKIEEIRTSVDDLLEVTRQTHDLATGLEHLVRYEDLQRRSAANHSRLQSYLRDCENPDEFCDMELANLINEVREVSAEVRTLEPNPISVPMATASQETELFLANISGSDSWLQMAERDYNTYWENIVDPTRPASLAQKLSTLEREQWVAINAAFGRSYDRVGVATASEFNELVNWINSGAIHNVQVPGRLGCVILQNPGLFDPRGEVTSVTPGYKTNFIFNYVTAKIDNELADSTSPDPQVTSNAFIRFEFQSNVFRRKYTKSDREKYSNPNFREPKCNSYFAFKKGFQENAKSEVNQRFKLIANGINDPVSDILEYRSLIEVSKTAKARLSHTA
mmetsp:Transcript_34790/g.44894  ORF Transcript_34790/g.44894 Transcript_34790/m.44894 type:complete len:389 (+) Transcript_34790:29-1195(+)